MSYVLSYVSFTHQPSHRLSFYNHTSRSENYTLLSLAVNIIDEAEAEEASTLAPTKGGKKKSGPASKAKVCVW